MSGVTILIETVRGWDELKGLLRQVLSAGFRRYAYLRTSLIVVRGAMLAVGGVLLLTGSSPVQITCAILLFSRTPGVFRRVGSGLADFRESERLGVARGTVVPPPASNLNERIVAGATVGFGMLLPGAVLIALAIGA